MVCCLSFLKVSLSTLPPIPSYLPDYITERNEGKDGQTVAHLLLAEEGEATTRKWKMFRKVNVADLQRVTGSDFIPGLVMFLTLSCQHRCIL